MATFYGQVKGNAKTTASRQGSMASGIKASVQSWNGSIITKMYYNADDELCIEVRHNSGSGFDGYTVFNGSVDAFISKLK